MSDAPDELRRNLRRPSVASSLASVPYSAHSFNPIASPNYQNYNIGTLNSPLEELTYNATSVVGSGAFGVVFAATVVQTGQLVAIKKVFLDPRFKNREVQILSHLSHPNIVQLYHYFYTSQPSTASTASSNSNLKTAVANTIVRNNPLNTHSHHLTTLFKTTSENSEPNSSSTPTPVQNTEVFVHLVMEFVPETLSNIIKHYRSTLKQLIPTFLIQTFTLQLFSALAYLHSLNIIHRDIKPQNALINPITNTLKLADFGSAKILKDNEPNTTYICSRFYRAPELLFGAVNYGTEIDVWAASCVFAEMLILNPIFPGNDHVDQLIQIIKILGTPTRSDILSLNPLQLDIDLPTLPPLSDWRTLFSLHTQHRELISDLLHSLLVFNPKKRLKAHEVQFHKFFYNNNNSNNNTNTTEHSNNSSNNSSLYVSTTTTTTTGGR